MLSPSLKESQQVGRYEITESIGVGAMGRVYKALDPMLNRVVALKTLRTEHLDEEGRTQFLARFQIEARTAARLTHPHIVQVFDFGTHDVYGPYIVMEYVPGDSLRKLIRAGRQWTPEEINTIVQDLASAIDEAHSKNILHRDIKPDNVIIMPDGRAKLADFGVARVPDTELTKEGQFVGTPWYAAPETIRDSQYSARSDGYGFAATVFEMITGKRVFNAQETPQLIYQVLNDEPIAPSQCNSKLKIPKSVDQVVLKGLSKAPEKRFQSSTNFAEALKLAYWRKDSAAPQKRSYGLVAAAAILLLIAWVAIKFVPTLLNASSSDRGAISSPGIVLDTQAPAEPATGTAANPNPQAPVNAEDEFDAYYPKFAEMSAHDREEAAKDELDAARLAFGRKLYAESLSAVKRAERLDPENQDAAALREEIQKQSAIAP